MVLPRISATVGSQHLRNYLGWFQVPFDTLQYQLLKALEHDPRSPNTSETESLERIEAVLKEVATRFQAGCLSQEHIKSLAETLGGAAWVPTASRNLCVARQGILEQINLGFKYNSVATCLLGFPGIKALLKQMGICDRPSQLSLFLTLQEISSELSVKYIDKPTQNRLVQSSVLILDELSRNFQGPDSELLSLLIPTEKCQLAPAREVLLNDMGGDPANPPQGLQFAHPLVTAQLAASLGLRRMSEEDFARGEDGTKDITDRIWRVLQDFDIDYSCNEWVANADEAGAKSVAFLVDEASFQGRRVISGLADFSSGPALVVHNDQVFTEEDFAGIGNIGVGGKAGVADSIGRFGLGALSFYHFSELPWVISGRWCLFLDPSKQYLPRERGNIRRSAALVPLSVCNSRYPDQLKPLEGLFGFSSVIDDYKGTIFRFSLRTASQAAVSTLSMTHFNALDITNKTNGFYAYANQSLFFTKSLTNISAFRRSCDLRITPVWSVRAKRQPIPHGVPNDVDAADLSLEMKAPQSSEEITERWIVTRKRIAKEDFPTNLQHLFPLHLLSTPTVGVAMNLSAQKEIYSSRLFATLPLPVPTSLPVHIHATWILTEDRGSLRYDAPDAAGHRSNETLYNELLLKKGVPPLYVQTLGIIRQHYPKVVPYVWPQRAKDERSQIVATALYELISSTNESVLPSV